MLKVNRKVEYGLVALRHMLGKPKGQLTSVREICDLYGTPFDPLAHVLRIMSAEGLVESEQGAHGGYRLVENMRNVNFAQLIEMIDGQLAFTECLREDECRCTMTNRCNIINPMHTFHNRLVEFLRSVTLEDLLQDTPSPIPIFETKKVSASI